MWVAVICALCTTRPRPRTQTHREPPRRRHAGRAPAGARERARAGQQAGDCGRAQRQARPTTRARSRSWPPPITVVWRGLLTPVCRVRTPAVLGQKTAGCGGGRRRRRRQSAAITRTCSGAGVARGLHRAPGPSPRHARHGKRCFRTDKTNNARHRDAACRQHQRGARPVQDAGTRRGGSPARSAGWARRSRRGRAVGSFAFRVVAVGVVSGNANAPPTRTKSPVFTNVLNY